MNNWNPSSWRDFPIKQQPTYNNLEKLKNKVKDKIKQEIDEEWCKLDYIVADALSKEDDNNL